MTSLAKGAKRPDLKWSKMNQPLLHAFAMSGIPEALKELERRYQATLAPTRKV